ncbi:hypothetical protein NCU09725 [Neurospora crassa OR74A]|uniref:Uncharacterized protein n=1 Tax=Neurospora crassa (strain ATCC 24698 / 74-OR23-1A / CBS 708.71 / DSM 1257 / FGSC 987) TaxID=367110 RepID=Q7S2Q1_NEUCR|nr:hypothetical protein NCU09725 [Neurospora crassa OR74A]EAA29728.3 hypothetical protein NCU09725 [Neurospora crassa OR74A]|eukprot:XP_958964.3 hypothetical protein NCU09725 [Neurospora crassa OR74A]
MSFTVITIFRKTTLIQRDSSSGFDSSTAIANSIGSSSTNSIASTCGTNSSFASTCGTSSPSGSSIITAINNGTNNGTTITDGASGNSTRSKKVRFVEEVRGWGRLDSRQWREVRRKERREAQFFLCRVPREQE